MCSRARVLGPGPKSAAGRVRIAAVDDGNICLSLVRSAGDLGAVFEWDGATGYFYLCATAPGVAPRIMSHIHIVSDQRVFAAQDLELRWDADECVVGLLIRGRPWAAFDATSGNEFGGNYSAAGDPDIPLRLQAALMRQ